MKILEAQSALLTNYEVYQFLADRQSKSKQSRRRGPGNLETTASEVLKELQLAPNPLSQQPTKYSPESVAELVRRLRPYNLAKGEVIQIINMRPPAPVQLHICIEEAESRFTEDQRLEILDIVENVLGIFPEAKDDDGEGEVGEEEDGAEAEATA